MRSLISFGSAVSVLLIVPLQGLCSEVYEYRFPGGTPVGASATTVWQGVIVEVRPTSVSPRFVTHSRAFISNSWKDIYPAIIKACKLYPDGFESSSDCFISKGRNISIPEGKTPYEYSYRFQFLTENGSKQEEKFFLEKGAHYKIKAK